MRERERERRKEKERKRERERERVPGLRKQKRQFMKKDFVVEPKVKERAWSWVVKKRKKKV